MSIADLIELIHEHAEEPCIGMRGDPLPIPAEMADNSIRGVLGDLPTTPILDGVRETMAAFAALERVGRLSIAELDV